jgi:hypothetical protein
VKVYRDGVRVFTYGEKNDDWLGLNVRRINTPAGKLGTNSVVAAIQLDLAHSRGLREKTNREGFDQNDAFDHSEECICVSFGDFGSHPYHLVSITYGTILDCHCANVSDLFRTNGFAWLVLASAIFASRTIYPPNRRSSSSDGSDDPFGDADVRIGDVETMLLNVFQTLAGIHPRPWLSITAQVDRLKGGQRGKLRR